MSPDKIVAVLVIAGALVLFVFTLSGALSYASQQSNTPGTASPQVLSTASTRVSSGPDPFIGLWRLWFKNGEKYSSDDRIQISADGTFTEYDWYREDGLRIYSGAWISQGDNSYILTDSRGKRVWKYLPATKTICVQGSWGCLEYNPYTGNLKPDLSQSGYQ